MKGYIQVVDYYLKEFTYRKWNVELEPYTHLNLDGHMGVLCVL